MQRKLNAVSFVSEKGGGTRRWKEKESVLITRGSRRGFNEGRPSGRVEEEKKSTLGFPESSQEKIRKPEDALSEDLRQPEKQTVV